MYVCMYVCTSDRPKEVCMYVCMLEAPAEHVCMYVSGSWACMYVCLGQLSMYVCMSQTYIHTNTWSAAHDPSWACMYVPKPRVLSSYVYMDVWGPPTPGIHLVCMYVCLRTLSMYVCMYVWQAQASMYVCLRLLSMYVCMSHSKLQNQLVSEGVKFLIKTLQNLTFNSFFFELWEGILLGA